MSNFVVYRKLYKKKTNRRHHWIKETLTILLPGKHFQGVLLLVFWDCSLYGKGPQNNQHQAQTQLRIHSFLYCNRKINEEHSLDFTVEDIAQTTFANSCKIQKHFLTRSFAAFLGNLLLFIPYWFLPY